MASVSPFTVRLTALPIAGSSSAPLPNDGALVSAANGRELGRRRDAFAPVRAGELVVRFTQDPPTLEVQTAKGDAIQKLELDAQAPGVRFSLGKSLLRGMGEGGPQFDRRGSIYSNRNGQGGYQLRTHGGRVPVQWLVSTDGWGVYIHRPLGAFDLTGVQGVLTPADAALPLDLFVTASPDPKAILGEYARITGHAELPPLWPSATCSRIARSRARTR
jgi:alpha-glucosidase/alpha-D-xyloside xylohydrolase